MHSGIVVLRPPVGTWSTKDKHILELEDDNHDYRRKIKARGVSNKVHLVEFMTAAKYLQDTVKRVWKAWRKSDALRLKEYQEVQAKLPHSSRKKPQEEEFLLAPCKLNISACSLEKLPKASKT